MSEEFSLNLTDGIMHLETQKSYYNVSRAWSCLLGTAGVIAWYSNVVIIFLEEHLMHSEILMLSKRSLLKSFEIPKRALLRNDVKVLLF